MAYELKTLSFPKLSGASLRFFARVLDNRWMRKLLLPRLLKDGGFDKLLTISVEDVPTHLPIAYTAHGATGGGHNGPLPLDVLENLKEESDSELPFHTAHDYIEAYRLGRTDPVDVAQRILDAICSSDEGPTPLRAFIANNREDLMQQAEESAKRLREGNPRSLLEGVPIACKDEVDQVPYPTTVGTSFWGHTAAVEDGTIVARLRAAGALLIGKTNMHEIGINPTGANAHHGTARNPYNVQHDPGGSSSGSAAAVAANLCPIAVAADGGGSIRIPAAFCGLVGLKATYARISEHGAAPLCWSVGHLGPVAPTTADAALMYAVIAGADPKDPNTLHQPPPDLENWNNTDLSGLTMGIYRPWYTHATPDIVAACDEQVRHFESLGATVQEIEIPMLDEMRLAHAVTILSEMATSMEQFPEHTGSFSPTVRINLHVGRAMQAKEFIHAQRIRTRAQKIFDEVLKDVDVIVTPSSGIVSPRIPQNDAHGWSDLSSVTESMRFIFPGNLVGLPAITFPVGYTAEGLPIGMHLMGRAWQESLLLRFSYASELRVKRQTPQHHHTILPED